MKITSNIRLLELLLQALDTTLVPELQSSNARTIAGIMQSVLADLIKRESRTATLMSQCNADGMQLLNSITALLQSGGIEYIISPTSSVPPATLTAQLQQHALLTEDLAQLTNLLLTARATPVFAPKQAIISGLLLKAAQWELSYYTAQQIPLEAPHAKLSAPNGPLTAERLTHFIQTQHPDGAAISIINFQPIPGGFGKQTSRFTLRDKAGREQELIARKSDAHPMLSNAGFIIENEFHLVKALFEADYLSPKPLWLGTGIPGVDASFYIMECLPGKIPGSFLGGLEDSNPQDMLLDVAKRLAELHALPLNSFSDYISLYDNPALLKSTVESCYHTHIAQWRHYAAHIEHLTSPFLHYILDWLERHVPADHRMPVLLHGDFNIHNLLVNQGYLSGVLDWECAMFGAPEQDLAYIQPHIAQHIDWDRFVAKYYESSGRELFTMHMPFYLAFSAMRLHIAMLRATRNLQTGANDDIRYAMVELGFGARFIELGLAGANPI